MGGNQVRVYPWHRLVPEGRSVIRPAAGFAVAVIALVVVLTMAIGFVGGGEGIPTPSATPSPSASPTSAPSATRPALITVPQQTFPAIPVIADSIIDVSSPWAMVSDNASVWVLAGDGRIDRIDPATDSVVESLAGLGAKTDEYDGLAVNDADLWVADFTSRSVYRVAAAPLAIATSIPAGQAPKGVLADANGVWVADVHGGSVLRIDPATNTVEDTIIVGPKGASGPNWLAEGLGSIWVDIPNNGSIVRIDPVTGQVRATILAPMEFTPCGGMAINDDAVWVTSCSADDLMGRIDANSDTFVAAMDMGGYGYNPVVINGFVWVSVDTGDAETGKLVRINPNTNTIDRVLVPSSKFGGGGDIVVAAGSVWAADGYNNVVIRLPMAAFGA